MLLVFDDSRHSIIDAFENTAYEKYAMLFAVKLSLMIEGVRLT